MVGTVERILRYPVKGLSAESLDGVELQACEGLPQDRRFAIVHGAAGIDPAEGGWRPKSAFVTLVKHERLAALESRFDDATGYLEILRRGRRIVRGQITVPQGRLILDQFLAAYLKSELPGTPRIIEAPGVMFTDTEEKLVSLINLASVHDLEQRIVGAPVDPLRFRGNLLLGGLQPWEEAHWVGSRIRIGAAELEVVRTIGRCAATNVEPGSGQRDLNIPQALRRGYGHTDCGVYARVVVGGAIAPGDAVAPAS
ncbi:MOSC domain-containing protein [Arenibaculum pallidiluteum]|uniref:MOSC domain-containing protein n=1 Tax=Arenibaculum pallidiluteum TaxID=2812559 RepID=UPI001A96B77A|nr:MOSC domain-containing protein [Arenibaculum pallidiluteum]